MKPVSRWRPLSIHPLIAILWVIAIIASTACTTLAVHAHLNPVDKLKSIQIAHNAMKKERRYTDEARVSRDSARTALQDCYDEKLELYRYISELKSGNDSLKTVIDELEAGR